MPSKMPFKIVRLEKKIDHKTLEDALIKAAEEIGWKAEVGYAGRTTQIKLKGRLFPAMRILFRNEAPDFLLHDNREYGFYDKFYILSKGSIGFVSKRKVKQYSDAVYRNL